MARNRTPLTPAMRRHLDDQMADALALGRELQHPSQPYPDSVWRAMRLAYAVHYRTLLEFFHNGRTQLQPHAKPPAQSDILVADVLSPDKDLGIAPTAADKRRFRAADKLAAHLSRHRTQYRAAKQEWGSASDQRALRRRITALFDKVQQAPSWFGRTARELDMDAQLSKRPVPGVLDWLG